MAEQQPELKPLVKGAVKVGERETLDFPIGKMIQVYISEGSHGLFDKEVEDRETKKKKTIKQKRAIYTFVVQSDIDDRKSGDSLKDKSFRKSINLSSFETATYPGFITAVCGEYTDEPAEAVGKPLQVMFGEWAKFAGTDFQPITYLPPAEGQTAPKKDVVITDPDEIDKIITEHDLFGPSKEA